MTTPLHVIILAAGQGSRMKSARPKVLHAVAGKPMLQRVIDTARGLDAAGIHVVIGHGAEQVRAGIQGDDLQWALQAQQLGTGHAVAQALPGVPEDARVLILYGDVPLISSSTLTTLLDHVSAQSLALLTVNLKDPTGYGRIVRDANGFVQSIVEQKDAAPEQLRICEVNTGILAVMAGHLKQWLPRLSNSNAQGEYYLTDIIAMAVSEQIEIAVAHPRHEQEVQGVNNREQLAELERWHQWSEARRLMAEGVTLADPARLDVRGTLSVGRDVFIDVNAVFVGQVELGDHVEIGPNCYIKDAWIAPGTVIEANSVLDGVRVTGAAHIGPFARLRPGTTLAEGSKVGNFVEIKKSDIGAGSKVNHLSYVGDAQVGQDVNVGAGTITCNYDGVNKFKTVLENGVFVGSNSALVAPVTVGEGATIGAGSVVTQNVGAGELAVGRGKQRNIQGWKRPTRKH
ncbi:MAG: bifunctional UDP-N-acetylglucosamine diphosphorylase/glucosamine-1-phosphate N-acetyltransferase GlmU [Gammaproteobacteria bacterium]|nr:bifunctional UDP-N-acetylglucosamine diphosphorylase/glucosamine-1-phosphate N-acetyltransferase GlmU [Gammaproteobacteria bacterium]